MFKTLLKPANRLVFSMLSIMALSWSNSALAKSHSLTLTMGLQNEAFTSDVGEDVTRMALGAVGAEYELNLSNKLSLGILGGAQVSFVSQETLSFGIGGFLNYYFKGSPIKSSFKSDSAVLSGSSRWAYFVGTGFEERLLKSEELDSEIRGGPFIRFGGRYIWNSEMFFSGNFKYLLGGAEYNSMDITFGIGFFL